MAIWKVLLAKTIEAAPLTIHEKRDFYFEGSDDQLNEMYRRAEEAGYEAVVVRIGTYLPESIIELMNEHVEQVTK